MNVGRTVRAYVGLGANVGDARRTLVDAVAALGSLPGTRLRGVSRLYVTRPVGEWNYEEATVDDDRVDVNVNGYEILNADIAQAREKPLDGKEHPGASRTEGHFGLCAHNDPVAFRNITIKRLPSKAVSQR